MQIKLHARARLTPLQRAEIQKSTDSIAQLARHYRVTEPTIRKWKGRTTTQDFSHTRHDLGQSTSPVEEELIVALRQDVRLGLDDIVEVMHRCVNPKLSRSAVYRCLKRRGVAGRLQAIGVAAARPGVFENADCGFIHMDLKGLKKLEKQSSFVFVAIDRATRFVHIAIVNNKCADTITACLECLDYQSPAFALYNQTGHNK
jgi:transposase